MGHSNGKPEKRQDLTPRLTGIRTPVAGVDWEPPSDERKRARRVLTDLAEEQVLWDKYHKTIATFVVQSVRHMDERLGQAQKDLPGDSILGEGLRVMQTVCQKFLEENQSARSGYGPPYEAQLYCTLGELRALFGVHVVRIAVAYGLPLDMRLEAILPPELK